MIRAKYVITLLAVAVLTSYANLASARQYTAKAESFGTSITRILARATTGDVVFVEAGVYDSTYETFPLQMKAGIALVGANAENTIISAGDDNAIEGDSAGVVLDNLTIDSNARAIFLDSASAPDGMSMRNLIIRGGRNPGGLAALVWNNDTQVTIENCEMSAYDGLGIAGSMGASTLDVEIRGTSIVSNAPPLAAEAAIGVGRANSVSLSDVTIRNFFENFQIHGINEITVDRLNGVSNVNSGSAKVLIRNSLLGYIDMTEAPSGLDQRAGGTMKIVDTMLVNGATVFQNHGEITLLNCYDQNLNPVTLP